MGTCPVRHERLEPEPERSRLQDKIKMQPILGVVLLAALSHCHISASPPAKPATFASTTTTPSPTTFTPTNSQASILPFPFPSKPEPKPGHVACNNPEHQHYPNAPYGRPRPRPKPTASTLPFVPQEVSVQQLSSGAGAIPYPKPGKRPPSQAQPENNSNVRLVPSTEKEPRFLFGNLFGNKTTTTGNASSLGTTNLLGLLG